MFVNSPQNIVSIRHGDHLPLLDLESCVQHLKGHLSAQMNAGACLCKLAFVELQDAADADIGAEVSYDYCDILLTQKGFKAIIEAYDAGVQVCLALCLLLSYSSRWVSQSAWKQSILPPSAALSPEDSRAQCPAVCQQLQYAVLRNVGQ